MANNETTAFLEIPPEVQEHLGKLGVSLEQIAAQSAPEASISYGACLLDDASIRSKSLVPIIIASSAGVTAVVMALTALLNTYLHRPHYAEWDELQEVIEDGKIVRDGSGNPIWKVKHRQGLVESRPSRRSSSLDLRTNPDGVLIRILTSSDEHGPSAQR